MLGDMPSIYNLSLKFTFVKGSLAVGCEINYSQTKSSWPKKQKDMMMMIIIIIIMMMMMMMHVRLKVTLAISEPMFNRKPKIDSFPFASSSVYPKDKRYCGWKKSCTSG